MKKPFFILLQSLFILFILSSCSSKNKDNEQNAQTIESCRDLLRQAEKAPVTELILPLGLKFNMTQKEVLKTMDEQVKKGSVTKVNDFYYTDFLASNQKFKCMVMFVYSNDSLSRLNFVFKNSMVDFDSKNKKYIIDELNKKDSEGYTFKSFKSGKIEKDNIETLPEYNYWIKNNIVIEFEADYESFYSVEYSNAPVNKPLVGLNLMLGIHEEVQKKMEEDKSKPENQNPNNKTVIEEIRKEEKVIEALLTDANVLYVSVTDDGTRRDGYAEYLCQIIKDHNATINSVKIVKAGSTKDPNRDNAYGVLLGECYCK